METGKDTGNLFYLFMEAYRSSFFLGYLGDLLPGGATTRLCSCSAHRGGQDPHRQHAAQEDAHAQYKQERQIWTWA